MRKKEEFPLVFIAALTVVVVISLGLSWPWRFFIAFMAAWPIALVWTVLSDAFRHRNDKDRSWSKSN